MNIVTLTFSGNLKSKEVQMFRGAFLKDMGGKVSTLFHNHLEGGLRFAYPLVQYKIINAKPSVVAIGKAGDELLSLKENFLTSKDYLINREHRLFTMEGLTLQSYRPIVDNAPKMYSITHYLPLNTDNLRKYHSFPALTDRICFLEKIINANILSFFKGIDYHCATELFTAISSIQKEEYLYYKGVKFWGFDLTFISNALLPNNIGLGKSASIGFGLLKQTEISATFRESLTTAH